MRRFFLSGQTTCAMLLGAGLLMRAQAALRVDPEVATPAAIEAPRARQAEMTPPRARGSERSVVARSGNGVSHPRKGFTHRLRSRHAHRRGVALAPAAVGGFGATQFLTVSAKAETVFR